MNKALIGIVGLVVVVGAGWYFLTQSNNLASITGDSVPSGQTASSSGTLADLAGRTGSWKCDVQSSDLNSQSNGTVYVSNGKIRGDFTSTVTQVGQVVSHMISDGSYVYVWTSLNNQGFKMPASTNTSSQTSGTEQNPYASNYSYNCASWSADASQFVLPANITFMAAPTAPSGSAGAGASGNASASSPSGPSCAQCDYIPAGAQRDQCRAALHC